MAHTGVDVGQRRIDDGTPWQIAAPEAEAEVGAFLVNATACSNPECECTSMVLEVRAARRRDHGPLYIDNTAPPLRWTASADGEEIEIDGPRPDAFAPETAEWIGERLRGAEARAWRRERWRRLRSATGDPAYAGGEPPDGIDGMIYFHEVFPWSFDLTVVHDRRRYAILDCYCLEPACRCANVVARFVDLSSDVPIDDAEIGAVRVSLSKIADASLEGRPNLGDLWRIALEEHGSKAFRQRHRGMREVARRRRRAAAPARPVVARKGPCPCGSGKKYKRCCGAQA